MRNQFDFHKFSLILLYNCVSHVHLDDYTLYSRTEYVPTMYVSRTHTVLLDRTWTCGTHLPKSTSRFAHPLLQHRPAVSRQQSATPGRSAARLFRCGTRLEPGAYASPSSAAEENRTWEPPLLEGNPVRRCQQGQFDHSLWQRHMNSGSSRHH